MRTGAWLAYGCVAICAGALAAEAPPLIVLEADANGEVVLTNMDREHVAFAVTIFNPSQKEVEVAKSHLTPFRNEKFELAQAELKGAEQPFQVKGQETWPLRVAAHLPKLGNYTARLSMLVNGKVYPVTLKVQRTLPTASTLQIADLQPVLVQVPFLGRGKTAARSLHVRETAGVGLSLSAPQLDALVYKPKPDVSFAVPAGRIETSVDKPITLPARGEAQLDVAIADIPRAGRYEATIRLNVPGAAPATKTWSLFAREHWRVAALFILLGTLVAYALRFYVSILQPRFALQSRVALVFQQLHELVLQAGEDSAGRQVVERVRELLTKQWDSLAASSRLIGTTAFNIYEEKIPLLQNWLRVRQWIPAGLPADVHKLAADTLLGTRQVLENPAATSAQVTEQIGKISALPSEIENAAAKALQQTLAKLKSEVLASTEPEVRTLEPQLEALQNSIGGKSLAEAFEELEALRRSYVEALSRALLQKLDGQPPFDMQASVWAETQQRTKSLLARVEDEKDADAAIARYHEATRALLRPLLRALSNDLALKTTVAGPQKDQFETLKKSVEALRKDLESGKIENAYGQAQLIFDSYRDAIHRAGRLDSSHAARLSAFAKTMAGGPATGGVDLLRFVAPPSAALDLKQSSAVSATRAKEKITSIGAALVVAVLAVLLGIRVLWTDDWTWGGGTSYLIAFLWGAGLYSFTYDGIAGLLKRFTS